MVAIERADNPCFLQRGQSATGVQLAHLNGRLDDIDTYEPDHPAWPGNLWDRARRVHDELLAALVAEVRRRADDREHAPVPRDLDLVSWTRRKVAPMVEGLFPAAERE